MADIIIKDEELKLELQKSFSLLIYTVCKIRTTTVRDRFDKTKSQKHLCIANCCPYTATYSFMNPLI